MSAHASLVERLGLKAQDRALIVNCDDVGMCHAENLASFEALTSGIATSATVMMPCPWVTEVARFKKEHPTADLGVHLTFTSEWEVYRWRPVLGLGAPSLISPEGTMWGDNDDVWKHATPEDLYREGRAQVELALALGLDPTHLDNHMGSIQLNIKLAEIYARLGKEFNLPLRLASDRLYALFGAPGHRKLYDDAGVLGPDELVYPGDLPVPEPEDPAGVPDFYAKVLGSLKPGTVTELYLHAAKDGPELESIAHSHRRRQADYEWLISPQARKLVEDLGIKLIGYRALRDLQRGK
jgi:hypothetical protein